MSLADDVARALPEMRAAAESLMTDTCSITRGAGTPVLNEDTGQYEGVATDLYEGRCRIRSGMGRSTGRNAGDSFARVDSLDVWLPLGTVPAEGEHFTLGDLITVTEAPHNPHLVGARYRVLSVRDNSQTTSLRLECEEA